MFSPFAWINKLYLYSIIKIEYMYVAVRYRQWFHRHSIHNLGTRILVINHLKIVLKGNSKHKTKDWWRVKSSHRAVAALVKFTGRAVLGLQVPRLDGSSCTTCKLHFFNVHLFCFVLRLFRWFFVWFLLSSIIGHNSMLAPFYFEYWVSYM